MASNLDERLRLIFMGTAAFAVPSLEALAGVLGGTQSLHTNALDEAIALPTPPAAPAPPREPLLEDVRVELESTLLRSGISLSQVKVGGAGDPCRYEVQGALPPPAGQQVGVSRARDAEVVLDERDPSGEHLSRIRLRGELDGLPVADPRQVRLVGIHANPEVAQVGDGIDAVADLDAVSLLAQPLDYGPSDGRVNRDVRAGPVELFNLPNLLGRHAQPAELLARRLQPGSGTRSSKNLNCSLFNGEPTFALRDGAMDHSVAVRAQGCHILQLRLAFLSG